MDFRIRDLMINGLDELVQNQRQQNDQINQYCMWTDDMCTFCTTCTGCTDCSNCTDCTSCSPCTNCTSCSASFTSCDSCDSCNSCKNDNQPAKMSVSLSDMVKELQQKL